MLFGMLSRGDVEQLAIMTARCSLRPRKVSAVRKYTLKLETAMPAELPEQKSGINVCLAD